MFVWPPVDTATDLGAPVPFRPDATGGADGAPIDATPPEDGAGRMLFRGRDLHVEPDEEPDKLAAFDFTPVAETTMFISVMAKRSGAVMRGAG